MQLAREAVSLGTASCIGTGDSGPGTGRKATRVGEFRQAELGYFGGAAAHLHDHPPLPVPFRRTVACIVFPVVPMGNRVLESGVCVSS